MQNNILTLIHFSSKYNSFPSTTQKLPTDDCMMVDSVIEQQNWLLVISYLLGDLHSKVLRRHWLTTKYIMNRQLAWGWAQASMPIMNNSIDAVMLCSYFIHTATTNTSPNHLPPDLQFSQLCNILLAINSLILAFRIVALAVVKVPSL